MERTCSGFVQEPSGVIARSLNGDVEQDGHPHAGVGLQAER